jgi:hypothetical protein
MANRFFFGYGPLKLGVAKPNGNIRFMVYKNLKSWQ